MNLNLKCPPRFIPLFFLIALPSFLYAQIQGTVHDINNQPLAFANVLLINQLDSAVVTGLMTSEVGTFSITNFTPGKYLVKASMIGYKTTVSEPFEVVSSAVHFHVPPIIVEEDSKILGDVDVVAKKPVYEQQIDRMVVNVENSITSTGSTALEVLEKSPGIIVNRQNKSLSMGGKEGVLVMINGKESRIPASAVIDLLNTMSAENIKKIELITTPPAKYEAEGDAGIINIVLKKDDDFGTNGIYTLGGGMGVDGKLNGSLSLNHHVKKVNYFGMYSYSYNNAYEEIGMNRQYNQDGVVNSTNSISRREPISTAHNYRLGLDYTISSKTVIGFLASGYRTGWDMDAMNDISQLENNVLTSRISQQIKETNIWNHYMGNINVEHFFKEDETLEFNVDYLHYDDTNPSDYFIQYMNPDLNPLSVEKIAITKNTPINTFVGKLDYMRKSGKDSKFEAGLKATTTDFRNKVSVANQVDELWTFNPDLTNEYNLSENISAVYSSLNTKIGERLSVMAGLRFEYTNTVLGTETEKGIIDRHYGKLFPTLFLSQGINDNNTIQFSYSRRISRPSFNELAPFIVLQSPDTYISGNENLQPSITNILKSDYRYKSVLFSITYSMENNAIRRFQPTQDSVNNILYLKSRNLDHVSTASIMLSFPLKPAKWWSMQNNFNGIMQNVSTDYDGKNVDINLQNYSINCINSFKIMKGFTGEISGYYQSPSLFGIYKSKPYKTVSAGVQLKSKDEKNTFSLNFSDVFNTGAYSFSADVPELNINNSGRLAFESQVLRFTFSHNFGSKKVKAERKRETGSEEERQRVN
jgi:outer membrane receptor protein involved in Fe transport